MADIFDQLLGDAPTDPSQVIAQLRRQNMLGQMAQLSGDKVLSPMGQQMQQRAVSGADALNARKSRKEERSQALALQQAMQQQAQSNADRSFGFQQEEAGRNEQFRRDQLAQMTADRAAARDVSLANAKEAADARRAASAQSSEKVARELRNERQKVTSSDSLVKEAKGLLTGDAAPNTDVISRGLRGTMEFLTGGTTSGGETLGKLQSIGSLLVQAAPKLGGGTSDRDVLLYQEAAGKLSDPTTPNSVKVAALDTMQGVISRNQEYFDGELKALTGEPTGKEKDAAFKSQFKLIGVN